MHDLQALPCPAGLVPVAGAAICSVVSGGAGSAVSGIGGSILKSGIGDVFDAASQWVAQGAQWLLEQVGNLMSKSTTVGLGTSWFTSHEHVMALLAAAVVLPVACVGAIQAVYRQSPSVLTRSFLVHLPLAMLLTGLSVELVRLGLSVTDTLSQQVLGLGGSDTSNVLLPVSKFLVASGSAPPFVIFIAAVVVAVCSFTLWLELVVRAAAVTAATLFLPLCLAALVWPTISHWCRRLAETIAALVLSKFVVAAVISLAAGALAGGLGVEGPNGGGFAAFATGVALLIIATVCPFTLMRLVPAIEAGAIGHLESVRHRMTGVARQSNRSAVNLARQAAELAGSVASGGAAAAGAGSVPATTALSGSFSAAGSNGSHPGGGPGAPSADGDGTASSSDPVTADFKKGNDPGEDRESWTPPHDLGVYGPAGPGQAQATSDRGPTTGGLREGFGSSAGAESVV